MANIQSPIDTTQPRQDQRRAAVEVIRENFGDAKVEVLDPKEVLQNYDAGNLELGAAADGPADGPVDGPADGLEDHYNCMTERFDPSSVASILVGLFTEIPRWKYGSTVNFAAYAGGYPNPEDAEFAAIRLWQAAQQWNSYDLGVKFEWVGKLEDATFVLEYGGDKSSVLASAFFPNSQALNTLFVYQMGLSAKYRGILKNIFLHELGHTLGLRHEFALDPGRFEGGAVVLGSRNYNSVMSYQFPPQVQKSDITDTKSFYRVKSGKIQSLALKDYIPG